MMPVDWGTIEITDRLLLQLLQLEDGELLAAFWNPERNTLLLRIRHEEMPKLEAHEGIHMPSVQLSYSATACGHSCDIGEHREVTREPINGKYWGLTHAQSYS
jgi:hypothetical protein